MCWWWQGGGVRKSGMELLSSGPGKAARSIGEHAVAIENKKVPPARCVHVGGSARGAPGP